MPNKNAMMKLALTCALVFGLTPAAAPRAEAASPSSAPNAAAQCRRADTLIPKTIRFARGRTTAVLNDTVRLCTSHEYRLRAKAGQTMSVHLAAGPKTSFTILPPATELEGADGVKDWQGELPDTGEYTITIGTDATAKYTLEVTIR
jgi:hypothetical protein